jgi:hypothetical protein
MAAEALRSSRFMASASLHSSSGFVGRRLQSSRTRWSRRETRRRAPGPGIEVHVRVAPGFHDARGRSTAPGRRGPVFPRLLRLPPPGTAARGDSEMRPPVPEAKGAAPGSSTGVPLFLPSFFPLLPPFSGGGEIGGKNPHGRRGTGRPMRRDFIGRRPRACERPQALEIPRCPSPRPRGAHPAGRSGAPRRRSLSRRRGRHGKEEKQGRG